jgi:hypothetical protein
MRKGDKSPRGFIDSEKKNKTPNGEYQLVRRFSHMDSSDNTDIINNDSKEQMDLEMMKKFSNKLKNNKPRESKVVRASSFLSSRIEEIQNNDRRIVDETDDEDMDLDDYLNDLAAEAHLIKPIMIEWDDFLVRKDEIHTKLQNNWRRIKTHSKDLGSDVKASIIIRIR